MGDNLLQRLFPGGVISVVRVSVYINQRLRGRNACERVESLPSSMTNRRAGAR